MSGDNHAPNFSIEANSDHGFASRSSNVFSQLDSLEARHEARQQLQASTGRSSIVKADPVPEDPLGSPEFKVPRGQPRWRRPGRSDFFRGGFRRTPDYRRHPEKWRRYDLSEVSESQMTDRSNAAAAFDFLRERKRQREDSDSSSESDGSRPHKLCRSDHGSEGSSPDKMEEDDYMDTEDVPSVPLPKPIFRKPELQPVVETGSTRYHQSGVVVMPEYVIGQKSSVASKTPKAKPTATASSSASANKDNMSAVIAVDYLEEGAIGDDESEEEQKDFRIEKMQADSKPDKPESVVKFKKSRKNKSQHRLRTKVDEEDEEEGETGDSDGACKSYLQFKRSKKDVARKRQRQAPQEGSEEEMLEDEKEEKSESKYEHPDTEEMQ